MNISDEQREAIARMLDSVGQDRATRERFQANPRAVLEEHGLADMVPANVRLEVDVADTEAAAPDTARASGHFDLPHVDIHRWPRPLPPSHFDWSHDDLILPNAKTGMRVTPVFRISIEPTQTPHSD